ncbi:hypothetical protein [Psychrobacillus psychrodurans]|uniref:hypothetical protein n=1 Tax=Psychrobacillus psychrodurans TaxID=126157 RepID=UPI003D0072A0
MKKIEVHGKWYEAEKIFKGSDYIFGFDDDLEIFKFRGVKDFSLFKLSEGDEYDLDENTLVNARLQATEKALINLMDTIMNGGL